MFVVMGQYRRRLCELKLTIGNFHRLMYEEFDGSQQWVGIYVGMFGEEDR